MNDILYHCSASISINLYHVFIVRSRDKLVGACVTNRMYRYIAIYRCGCQLFANTHQRTAPHTAHRDDTTYPDVLKTRDNRHHHRIYSITINYIANFTMHTY